MSTITGAAAPTGNLRPLHLDRAAAVLRYTPMAARACQPLGVTAHAGWTETALCACDYFAARLDVETRAALTCGGDSFRHLLCVEEGAVVHGGVRYPLRQGDSYSCPPRWETTPWRANAACC